MAKVYEWSLQVRSYEVNEDGNVPPAVLQNWLEETAVRASTANGFSPAWYSENECTWVIRRMTVRYFEPVRYGDEVTARSWVSTFRRVRSNREYELRRASDGQRLVRGRADWVFLNTRTRRIQRIPQAFLPAFDPDPTTLETLVMPPDSPLAGSDSPTFQVTRPVYTYEIDELGHVNNAHYFRWIEDATWHALDALDWGRHTWAKQGLHLRTLAHDIEYKQETRPDETVILNSRLTAVEGPHLFWQHTLCQQNGDLIAQDEAVLGLFAGADDGQAAVVVPAAFQEALDAAAGSS